MDAPRFDSLVRTVGQTTSRRRALAVLAGGLVGLTVPGLARADVRAPAAGAAPPLAVPSRARQAFACRGDNTITVPCTEVENYIKQCGWLGPFGTRVHDAYGITLFNFIAPIEGPVSTYRHPSNPNLYCAERVVRVPWSITRNTSGTVLLQPENVCCADRCRAALDPWTNIIVQHEADHRSKNVQLIAEMNAKWAAITEPFVECAGSVIQALQQLNARITRLVEADKAEVVRRSQEHELPPGPPCQDCQSTTNACQLCTGDCFDICSPGTCCPTARGFGGCCPTSDPNCCERSCCPPAYSVCCGRGSDACCPWDRECVFASDGIWCRRRNAHGADLDDRSDWVPAHVARGTG
jgi:hypothetical protein